MTYTSELLAATRGPVSPHPEALADAIRALGDCAQSCAADVDDDLSEPNLAEMVRCVRLCQDSGDLCTAAVRVLSRQAESDVAVTGPLLEACIAACAASGEECERHAPHHEHCRICAQACRRCEQACRTLLSVLTG